MTRRIRIAAAVIAAALLGALLSGCAIAPEDDMTAVMESATPTAVQEIPQTGAVPGASPLEIARDVRAYGTGYIVYPRVFGSAAETINTATCNAVAERAKSYDGAIFTRYRIEYNDHGIFSVLISVYDFHTDKLLFLVPLTFDSVTGELHKISDFLYDEQEIWRTVLPDMMSVQAEKRAITLLSDIAPVTDDQDFYITSKYLVVVYRVYEIATYAAGSPEFRLPLTELAPYIAEGSALSTLIKEGPQ